MYGSLLWEYFDVLKKDVSSREDRYGRIAVFKADQMVLIDWDHKHLQ